MKKIISAVLGFCWAISANTQQFSAEVPLAERASQLTRDMAVTRPPALPTDKPVSPLARLHRERTVIMGELAVLNVSAARLRQAENAEAAVHREFADLSSSEIDAVANWARSPIGEPPPPDQKLRRALAEKLAATQSAAAVAKGVLSFH
jgi:hypothetical protein